MIGARPTPRPIRSCFIEKAANREWCNTTCSANPRHCDGLWHYKHLKSSCIIIRFIFFNNTGFIEPK